MQLKDEEKIVQNKSYENTYDYEQCKAWQARSHKFAIEGVVLGAWGRSPQRLKILHFFFKNNLILGAILIKNHAFKTWHRNW